MAIQFFICTKCKKIVEVLQSSSCQTLCCGQEMKELKANTSDGAQEKHVPVVEINGDAVHVKVGSVAHPMEADHWIQWIALETSRGAQKVNLAPQEKPEADFLLNGAKPLVAYEYCNKHGLWKAES